MSDRFEFNHNAYIVHEKLGEGGMGVVYRATHRLSGKQVALKSIRTGGRGNGSGSGSGGAFASTQTASADTRLALAHEFQILSSLHHPHIVGVLDYGFD